MSAGDAFVAKSFSFAQKSRPAKIPRRTVDLNSTCLCHVFGNEKGAVMRFTEKSWSTLVQAARVRQDGLWETLVSEGIDSDSEPQGTYHRRCYQSYTHKKTLKGIAASRKASNAVANSSDSDGAACGDDGVLDEDGALGSIPASCGSTSSIRKRITRSMTGKTNLKACLLCQKRT